MLVLADTHVHFYPVFDMREMFTRLCANIDAVAGGREHVKVACLAERSDCDWFQRAKSGEVKPPEGFKIDMLSSDPGSVLVLSESGARLYIVAGRQLRTLEGLEVLGLTTASILADGMTARDAVRAVTEAGGVPVLAWAVGKWSFARGRIVACMVASARPGELLMGDSSLRPEGWNEPGKMKEARK